ncbi:MAG TPA: hypothetical protein VJN22_08775 [Candidatus Eremiobacteraceae bacterium]|nr:hypothetical protein [Candidatus Eremiobacteraceae bacterium]
MRLPEIRAIAVFVLAGLAAVNASCAGTQAVLSRHIVGPSPSPSTSPSQSPSPTPSTSPSPSPSPSPTPSGSPPPSPSPTPSPSPQLVGINLFNGPSGEQPTIDPNYGQVLGYFSSNGTLNVQSQVVMVPAGAVVTFESFDLAGIQHTASFLGDATQHNAPWPSTFNGSETQSPAGTVINTPNFSSGPLDHKVKSPQYLTPAPGFYMFGCFFHYSSGMRTVIISQ